MKNLTVLIILGVLGIGGYIWWQGRSATVQETVTTRKTEEMSGLGSKEIAGPRYVEFSQEVFEKAADKRRVLFFYASWCPICRPADTSYRENTDRIPDDVVIFRVNFNDPDTDAVEKELARKYRIAYQHTYVLVDSEGSVLKEWNSGEIEELLQNLR